MTAAANVHVGWGAEALAGALEALPDYRVLRRLEPLSRSGPPRDRAWSGVVLDVETTGLSCAENVVIELAMQRVGADAQGRIVETGRPQRWLEDPGFALPEEIVRLTGISDAAVWGRSINEAVATSMLLDADFVVAHNAGFDRGFVEARLPGAAGRPWICSMRDVDWRAAGFEGRALSHLVSQVGWFYSAHRADVDVAALVRLLDHRPVGRVGTVLLEAIETARRPTWIVEAVGAPFAAKDLLRARGYRWRADARHWWREVAEDRLSEERTWCAREVYGAGGGPDCRRVDWTTRYAA